MKSTLLFVSCLSLGLGVAAGCGGKVQTHSSFGSHSTGSRDNSSGGFTHTAAEPRLRGAAVGNYNKGYVDGVNASAFFNKGQPLTDAQVDRLIDIGRRQGDPTGLLALNGYPEGYRTGAKHARNPYEKQLTPDQVAQVRKAQGLPPVEAPKVKETPSVGADETHASAQKSEKKQRREEKKLKQKAKKEQAEASARD